MTCEHPSYTEIGPSVAQASCHWSKKMNRMVSLELSKGEPVQGSQKRIVERLRQGAVLGPGVDSISSLAARNGPVPTGVPVPHVAYHLVIYNITMENHTFSWLNSLSMVIFHVFLLEKLPYFWSPPAIAEARLVMGGPGHAFIPSSETSNGLPDLQHLQCCSYTSLVETTAFQKGLEFWSWIGLQPAQHTLKFH